jgi:hypothetical protein
MDIALDIAMNDLNRTRQAERFKEVQWRPSMAIAGARYAAPD